MVKKKGLTYGRKFRNKSGQTVRYVYKHRKKIGVVLLLAADAYLPDSEAELTRTTQKIKLRERVRHEINILKAMYTHGMVLWIASGKKR